jgi:class 3 adenylate cyclase
VEENEKTGLDLFIFRDGTWTVHRSYEAMELEQAEQDAKALKRTGSYIGICLIHHKTKSIIFEHNTRGDVLTYSLVTTGGVRKRSNAMLDTSANIRKARTVDQSSKGPPANPTIPLAIVGVSFVLAGILAKVFSESPGATGGVQFMVPVGIVVIGCIVAFITYMTQMSGDMADDVGAANAMARKWKNLDAILKDSLQELKKHLVSEEGALLGDSHFAIILMGVGIGDGFVKYQGMPKNEVQQRVTNFIGEAGISAEGTMRVWEDIYEYLVYPRYRRMYDKGKFITKTRMENWSAELNIEEEAQSWLGENTSAEEEEKSKDASVLFTDIIDFTSSHQRHGDEWMVDVIRAHNEVARTALNSFGGREVKHTGDGIMASFPSALLAMQAALAMQKGFIQFAEAMPHRAFDVRIGISAGEPIHMGDDLFGTPVNLASRVMSFGKGRDIMLAQAAYDICKDSQQTFDTVTGCELKGFEGEHTLYRINCGKEKQPPKVRENMGESFDEKEKASFLKEME